MLAQSILSSAVVTSLFLIGVVGLPAFADEPEANASEHAADSFDYALSPVGNLAAYPFYGSSNPIGGFQHGGLSAIADYSVSPYTAPTSGIATLTALYAGHWFEAQATAGLGTGFVTVDPGVGFRFGGFHLGLISALQLNSVQFDSATASALLAFGNQWTLGARVKIAVVSYALESATVGLSKGFGWLHLLADLQADGSLGTFRLWPGVVADLSILELGLTGAIERTNNWVFFADSLRASVGVRLGHLGFLRAIYETPYAAGLTLALTL